METRVYDEVDALAVLHLNLLCLNFALTPERAAALRRSDPRPFPFFALYAEAGGAVAGQVGVFRLPVLTAQGPDEVGGVWAVATHPAFRRQGIAAHLLEEAHAHMRAAGLAFSTLGTARSGVAYALYRRLGYEEVWGPAEALARAAALPAGALHAQRAGPDGPALADRLFERAAVGRLGFARRHAPFFPALEEQGALACGDLWLLHAGATLLGYAVAQATPALLRVRNLLLLEGADPPAAAGALARAAATPYVRLRLDTRADGDRFARPGCRVAAQSDAAFLVKPLAPGLAAADFRRLAGLDDGRFLASDFDIT